MIRQHLIPKTIPGERYFRWRGGDVSRIEALSDAVFALALTLIVVTLEVPRSFDNLMGVFRQAPLFLICFALLLMCWYFHFLFHRRYGLEDFVTAAYNGILLFLILLYVYPMKFLFTFLMGGLLGDTQTQVTWQQGQWLMVLYGGGFASVFGVLALMNYHAWRKRDALELNAPERAATRGEIRSQLIFVGFGVVSSGMALADPRLIPASGMLYFGIGPVQGIHGWLTGREVERLARAEQDGSGEDGEI